MRPAGAQLCRAPEFCSTSLETASPPKVEGRLANRHPSLLWMVSKSQALIGWQFGCL